MKFFLSHSSSICVPSDLVSEDHNLALVHLSDHSFFLKCFLTSFPFSSKHGSTVIAGLPSHLGDMVGPTTLLILNQPSDLHIQTPSSSLTVHTKQPHNCHCSEPFSCQEACSHKALRNSQAVFPTGVLDAWQLRYSLLCALLHQSFLLLIINDLHSRHC